MIYLFIHQNFPGQYQHLVRYLANDRDNTVYFVSQPNANWMRNVIKVAYHPELAANLTCHPYAVDFDHAVRNAVAVAKSLEMLRDQGVVPHIIIGHSGWGETMFVKDIYPSVPLLTYMEFFYHQLGVDTGFDPEFRGPPDDGRRLRAKNTVNFLSLDAADWGHTPTAWQRNLYPPELRGRITQIHEGIDTDRIRPDSKAWLKLSRENKMLTGENEIITYVARNLEPYRGFHIFMRALPQILRRRPNAQVLVVGGDSVSYGCPPPPGTTYRQLMMYEVGAQIDVSRVHFLGQLPYDQYLSLLQISSAHVYLTYPFVLSWSFLEAMAAGCAIVGSGTPPVLEVMEDGINGLCADFFSPEDIADKVDLLLENPEYSRILREGARKTATENFDLERKQLPQWMKLVEDLIDGKRPDTNSNSSHAKEDSRVALAKSPSARARRKSPRPVRPRQVEVVQ